MSPFDCYQTYLSLKNHFTKERYDFFQYGGRTRASMSAFNKRKDKYWFEKMSRQRADDEIRDYFIANFIASDTPEKIWIGGLIKEGESQYQGAKEDPEFELLVQRTIGRITIESRIRECFRLFQGTSNTLKKISRWKNFH